MNRSKPLLRHKFRNSFSDITDTGLIVMI